MLIKHPLLRLFIITGIAITFLMVLPLKFPFSISTYGKVYHGKEWVVRKDENGRLSASLYDRMSGRTENFRLHQFERQDAVRFELHDSITPGNFVHAGDTVGKIHSTQLNRELISLIGQLAVSRASLDLYLTGEKETVIEEARNRLAYAEQQVAGHTILLNRQKELHRRNLISDEELDIAVQQNRLYEIDIAIAAAQLETAMTGDKAEQIHYLQTRISSIEDELNSLEEIFKDYTYISPIDGIVYHTFSADTLALIGDPSNYLAVIPVSFNYRPYITHGQRVKLRIPGNNVATRYGTIHSIGNTVRVLDGGQYFMINAIVENENDDYLPGVMATAFIETERVTIREYLLRYLRPLFN